MGRRQADPVNMPKSLVRILPCSALPFLIMGHKKGPLCVWLLHSRCRDLAYFVIPKFLVPQIDSQSQIYNANYTRVLIIFKLKCGPTPFQHPSTVGEESMAGSPGRAELLKGKLRIKGVPVLLSWDWVRST